jgi:OPA family glycerol-3-phosphate transporter-like MFS transporter
VLSAATRLRLWQIGTLSLLVVGYAGYYLCRSNLSVVMPLLITDLGSQGIAPADARVRLGTLVSLGTLAYSLGKFASGTTADFLGGRRNFLGGMAGAVLCTLLFAASGTLPLFTLAWVLNRLVQSFGWSGMIHITGRWFDYTAHGTAVAVLSLSYQFGDAAARAFMGLLLGGGLGWRGVFLTDAAVLGSVFVLCLGLLKGSPRTLGLADAAVNPHNVFGTSEPAVPTGPGALLGPLLRSPGFWLVCLLSLALTFLRETFNTWAPTYFKEAVHVETEQAAYLSAALSFLGGCSVLLAGIGSDRLGRHGRAAILCGGLLLAALGLVLVGRETAAREPAAAVVLVLLSAFLVLGPYSYLAGAVSLDFGGRQGAATACGIVDGVGYLGGVLAGGPVAGLVGARGWPDTFGVLAGVAFAGCLVAALFWYGQACPSAWKEVS